MSWNYRVVYHRTPVENFYQIHEVYYDADGNPEALTRDAMSPFGEEVAELRADVEQMLRAFERPVLDYDTLEELS